MSEQVARWKMMPDSWVERSAFGEFVAATDYDRLRAENARLRAQQEWQPIETAPKDGTPVDIWCHSTGYPPEINQWRATNCTWSESQQAFVNGTGIHRTAVAWRLPPVSPLPSPQAKEKQP